MFKIGSIGMSFVYNLFTDESEPTDAPESHSSLVTNMNRLQVLRKTLEQHGGLFSKVAQMLAYSDQDSSVFSECKPYAREETVEYLKNYIQEEEIKYAVDLNIYKSGSIGQVHIGMLGGKPVAVKVQYTGLYEKTEDDINALNLLTNFLYMFTDVKEAINDVKKKVYEELDYNNETRNHENIYNIWKDSDTYIPIIYKELCTEKILVTEFIEGDDLSYFINNSSQENKNKISKDIVKFIFTNIYVHGIFYSDTHYGNIIIQDDNRLAVIDFGCLNYLNKNMVKSLRTLHKSLKCEDKELFLSTLTELDIINSDVSQESRDYAYEYFRLQYEPWIIENEFEFTQEWWEKSDYKNVKLMSEWKLPQNMVYFNKIPYGLYNILTALNGRSSFFEVFNDIFDKDEENNDEYYE